jgi:hypothetical protein
MKQSLLILLVCILLSSFTVGNTDVKEYLSIPSPIHFEKSNFNLAWSSNPDPNYFKQEYTPSGESVEKYNKMILVEVVFGDFTVKEAVKSQLNQIEQRKRTDKLARYQVIENPNTGEVIVDFLMSAETKNSVSVVEWNAYRYKAFQDEAGRKGILLFAISKRGYDNQINSFFETLKADRIATINQLGAYELPVVDLKK